MENLGDAIQRAIQSDRPSRPPTGRRVRDIMSTHFYPFHPEDCIREAVQTMLKQKIAGGPVLENGVLVGMISEADCLKELACAKFHGEGDGPSVKVGNLMTPRERLKLISPDTSIFDLAHAFIYHGLRRLPVMDGDRLVGHVSRQDLLRELLTR